MTALADQDAEAIVLGAALMSAPVADRLLVDHGLTDDHFTYSRYMILWSAIGRLRAADRPIDVATLSAESTYADVGELWAELTGGSGLGNWPLHAARMKDLTVWRRRRTAALELAQAANDRDDDAYAHAESTLAGAVTTPTDRSYTPEQLGEQLYDYLTDTVDRFRWPFKRLDELTCGGARRGQVTILGGHSSHGKSALLDQCLTLSALEGAKVGLLINEMTPVERAARLVARGSGVDLTAILTNELDAEQRRRVVTAMGGLPFPITDVAGWSEQDIARFLRRRRYDVAGVDILHLIDYRDERDVARISATLNRAAKQADCHLIVTSHLNENRVTMAVRSPPSLGDLRGSGSIKNDADNVLFVHREQDEFGRPEDEAHIYFAKVRMGRPGGIDATFDGTKATFTQAWRA